MKRIPRIAAGLALASALAACTAGTGKADMKAAADQSRLETIGLSRSWLAQLDSVGYAHIASIGAYRDNMTDQELADAEAALGRNGKAGSRKLRVFMLWTGERLLVQEMDGDEPAKRGGSAEAPVAEGEASSFSLIRTSPFFRKHADKKYAAYLYETSAGGTDGLHELLVFWMKDGRTWEPAAYNIGEDV